MQVRAVGKPAELGFLKEESNSLIRALGTGCAVWCQEAALGLREWEDRVTEETTTCLLHRQQRAGGEKPTATALQPEKNQLPKETTTPVAEQSCTL